MNMPVETVLNVPVYTALLAAFLIMLQTGLMLTVGLYRAKGAFIGLNEDPNLERKVRRHGNLAENAGLFLAALAVLELLAGQTWYVATLCAIFMMARLLHAIGFSSLAGSHGENLTGARKAFAGARFLGAMGTLVTALGTAAAIVITLA